MTTKDVDDFFMPDSIPEPPPDDKPAPVIIPYGYCHCGCGKRTLIARVSNTGRHRIKGEPYRFFHGHAFCQSGPEYLIEDRGYKTPCWAWQRHINRNGYGMMRDEFNGGKLRSAHKTYYERKYGPVADGLQLDHLCRVRCCVNPQHLEQVTHMINVVRGISCTITSEQIGQTKKLLSEGHLQNSTAQIVGISQSAVSDIKFGRKDHRLND